MYSGSHVIKLLDHLNISISFNTFSIEIIFSHNKFSEFTKQSNNLKVYDLLILFFYQNYHFSLYNLGGY